MEHYTDIQGFINDCRRLFNNAYLFYQVSSELINHNVKCFNYWFFYFLKEDTKTFQYARELEKFFDMQLKKWLPKYSKSVITTPQQHKSYNMCDFIDDGMIDDPTDEDFVPKNGAKRPRSTPSV